MRHVERVQRWLRDHPLEADATLGALVAVLGVVALVTLVTAEPGDDHVEPNAVAFVLVIVDGLVLTWRRQAPVAVLAVGFCAYVAYYVKDFPDGAVGVATLIAVYTVAAHTPRRRALVVGVVFAISLLAFLTVGVLVADAEDLTPDVFAGNLVIYVTAWVLGDNVRNRRERLAALEERAVLAERGREEAARKAVDDERSRIARELHDVVAHGMSVMVVQAGAARRVLDRDVGAAREAIASIEAVGRQSLTEMRRLLGVLRQDEPVAALAPQPGVDQLAALVSSAREAGLAVELVIEGEARPLPPGVELSAYRIVQEALTNALKHAGRASACVRVCYRSDDLALEVLDDGRGAVDGTGSGGHGLLGMRERVELFGGELHAANRRGGGFAVRARLPFASTPA